MNARFIFPENPGIDTIENLIDLKCDEFESAIRSNRKPTINEYLSGWPEPVRSRLLRELLLVDLEYQSRQGKSCSVADYRMKNPSDQALISSVIEQFNSLKTQRGEGNKRSIGSLNFDSQSFGDFKLIEQIGSGGMGVVFKAHQQSVNRIVALKFIRSSCWDNIDAASKKRILQRFKNEARAAGRIEHDHIVTTYEVGQVEDTPFIAMQFVEGTDLRELVMQGPLESKRAARYVSSISSALEQAHEVGVFHRDIKPANLLLNKKLDRVLISDFGLARLYKSDGQITVDDELLGSPAYMAPEQARSPASITETADIYSLGATLYHLLTGRPPFQAQSIAETIDQVINADVISPRLLNPSIDRDAETICLKCLSKDPVNRYQSAAKLTADLEKYLNNRPITAKPPGWFGKTLRWGRRHPGVALLSAILMLVLLAGTTISLAFAWKEHRARRRAQFQTKRALEAESDAKAQRLIAIDEKRTSENARRDAIAVLAFFQDHVLSATRPLGVKGGTRS